MSKIQYTTTLSSPVQTTSVIKMASKLKKPTTATVYEILSTTADSYNKPYFDIDYKESEHPTTFAEMLKNKEDSILKPSTDFICKHFKCKYSDLAISESSYTDKISYHVIIPTMKVNHFDLVEFKNHHTPEFKKLNMDPAVYGRGAKGFQKFRMCHTTKEVGKVKSPSTLKMLDTSYKITDHFISYTEGLPIFELPKAVLVQSEKKLPSSAVKPKPAQVMKHQDGDNTVVDNIRFIINNINTERSFDTSTWMKIVFAIFNEAHENGIDADITSELIHSFSMKSENEIGISNYNKAAVTKYINNLKPGSNQKCTIATLLYYLKEDNIEKFNEYQSNNNPYSKLTYDAIKTTFELTHFKTRSPLGFYEILGSRTTYYSVKDFKQLNTELFYYRKVEGVYKKKKFITAWFEDPKKREYDFMDFYPDPTKCPPEIYNTFDGFAINDTAKKYTDKQIEDADITNILDHIKNVLCNKNVDGYEYVLKWCANIVQQPDTLSRTALIFKSKEGVGKGLFMTLLEKIVGVKYTLQMTGAENIFGAFNDQIENRLLINMNEASGSNSFDFVESLKSCITDDKGRLQKKYHATREINNYIRYIIFTNNDNCVKISDNDRRYVGFQCGEVQSPEYYNLLTKSIMSELCQLKFYKYLMAIDIKNFNFTANRPITAFYNEMRLRNASAELLFIKDLFDEQQHSVYTTKSFYNMFKEYLIESGNVKYQTTVTKFGLSMTDIPGVEKYKSGTMKYRLNFPMIKTHLEKCGLLEQYAFDDDEDNNEIEIESDSDSDVDSD